MAGILITDRRGIREIPALDVKDPELAQQLAETPMSEVDSEIEPYTPPEEVKDTFYNIKPLKLHFGEYLKHHSFAADSTGWKDQFKKLLPGVVGDASVLTIDDVPVATYRRDTKLAVKKLEKEQPHIIAKFTRTKTVEYFDETAFRAAMPDMYHAYRGRSFRLKKTGPGAGLILPTI